MRKKRAEGKEGEAAVLESKLIAALAASHVMGAVIMGTETEQMHKDFENLMCATYPKLTRYKYCWHACA